jgi:hypothetical protein
MSVLPKITYGNMALIFLHHFHGYYKNEIFADYWDIGIHIGSAISIETPPVGFFLKFNNV